jgi:hypothetical protein
MVSLNASSNLKANAYVAATRIYDEDLYLVPAIIDEKVTYFFNPSSLGFRTASKTPVVEKTSISAPAGTPSTELMTYEIDGLKILVPQDKGIWTKENFRKLRLYHQLYVYESDLIVGKLIYIPKANRRYKELFVRRGGLLLKETEMGYVVLVASDTSKKDFLKQVSAYFRFE